MVERVSSRPISQADDQVELSRETSAKEGSAPHPHLEADRDSSGHRRKARNQAGPKPARGRSTSARQPTLASPIPIWPTTYKFS